MSGVDAENGCDSVDDSDSLGNSGSKKSNLTPTSAAPSTGTATKEKRNRPFFKKVRTSCVGPSVKAFRGLQTWCKAIVTTSFYIRSPPSP